jgi:hypothetical protein
MAKHSSHILEMARKGAQHRYDELRAEIASLTKNFPHLGGRKNGPVSRTRTTDAGAASPAAESGRTGAGSGRAARKRRTMSAAARKAVSDRMKTYWAARRAGRKKK